MKKIKGEEIIVMSFGLGTTALASIAILLKKGLFMEVGIILIIQALIVCIWAAVKLMREKQ